MRLLVVLISLSLVTVAQPQRQMEKLRRGPIAVVRADGKVYLSWRLLGIDPDDIAFHIYRDGVRLSDNPILTSTNFVDAEPTIAKGAAYEIRAILDGKEGGAAKLTLPANAPAR